MQRRLSDQRVVVLLAKAPRHLQGAGDGADGLELCSRIADAVLVDGERLGEEFVGEFFEAALVGDLAARDKEAEAEFGGGGVDAGV